MKRAAVFVLVLWAGAASGIAAEDVAEGVGGTRLLLPPVISCVPGVEADVYFDNATLVVNPANYVFDVTCDKGAQQAERWTFTPAAEDAGEYPFTLEIRDQTNAVIATARSTVKVVPANAGAGAPVSALLIGDSLTHASVYSARLLELCAGPGNPKLTLVGSHVPNADTPENRHEGYGGWTANRFATQYTGVARTGPAKERGSPFLYENAGERRLDVQRYCDDVNGGALPDFVTIFLGCNDTFSATDETIEARIDDMFAHLDALIAMIRQASGDVRIGLMPPVPPAATQDAFGANYRSGQTRWQYKRNQHRVVERMYERYGGRDGDGITLIPAFLNLDCRHNFPQAEAPRNAHTPLTGVRLINGVHPAPEGYRQIGDAVYCWLKAQLISP